MKIYASQETSSDWVEKYAGMDLWVRVYNPQYDQESYVKIRSIYPSPWDDLDMDFVSYSECSTHLIDLCLKESEKYTWNDIGYMDAAKFYKTSSVVERGLDWFKSHYTLIIPTDAMTTEELLEIIGGAIHS
jgi:hypothetical protein